METKFRPRGFSDSDLVFGAYFKSENDVTTQYFIKVFEGEFEGSAIAKIYTTDVLENHFKTDGLVNGSIIGMPEYELEWIAEVNLCGKYFFPKFNNELQLYYDDYKYYKEKYKSDPILSLAEAMNFAIEYGLKEKKIKPY